MREAFEEREVRGVARDGRGGEDDVGGPFAGALDVERVAMLLASNARAILRDGAAVTGAARVR